MGSIRTDVDELRDAPIYDANGNQLLGAGQQSALTAADGGTVDATYGADERDVIQNLVTRVGELETALQNLNLIAT